MKNEFDTHCIRFAFDAWGRCPLQWFADCRAVLVKRKHTILTPLRAVKFALVDRCAMGQSFTCTLRCSQMLNSMALWLVHLVVWSKPTSLLAVTRLRRLHHWSADIADPRRLPARRTSALRIPTGSRLAFQDCISGAAAPGRARDHSMKKQTKF